MLSFDLSSLSGYPFGKTRSEPKKNGVFKRGEAPLFDIIPLPSQGGDKGGGLPNKNLEKECQGIRRLITPLLSPKVGNHSEEFLGA